ncbi:unnamed protein product [Didymodactylos carnosus]|uniref:Uncharacterized protein n=1 Tax=Didymodactylos carnosus TaxID=1234261 RepID=A0A815WBL4_9BILA|nr:unnamed protein product [Didymodactylos carnosus]CAF4403759.1 unnamed protein product [Didymodactylos carnosus]
MRTRLQSPIRKSVSKYVKCGLSQTQIKSSLVQDHPNAPITETKLINLVSYERRKDRPEIFSVFVLQNWCNEHNEGITSSQQTVFPHSRRMMCWFHMIQKCRLHRNLVTKEQYEGAAFGKPSTKNGCESMNAIIKQKYTLRNKLQLSAFLPKMEQMLTDWSEASISSPFAAATSISPDTELYAYKWSVSINRFDIFHWFNTFYVVPSSGLGIVFNLYQVTDKTRCEPLGKRKGKGRCN